MRVSVAPQPQEHPEFSASFIFAVVIDIVGLHCGFILHLPNE